MGRVSGLGFGDEVEEGIEGVYVASYWLLGRLSRALLLSVCLPLLQPDECFVKG